MAEITDEDPRPITEKARELIEGFKDVTKLAWDERTGVECAEAVLELVDALLFEIEKDQVGECNHARFVLSQLGVKVP